MDFLVQGARLEVAGISALCGGLVFGVTMALATRGQRRDHREVLGRVSVPEWKVVRRAAWSGPVPDDPRLRADALELANRQLARSRRYRIPATIIFGLNLVLQAVNGIAFGSRWSFVGVASSIAALILQWYTLRRLDRRVAVLES